MSVTSPKTDKEWQAYDDARTLAHAEEIRGDSKRLSGAKAAAVKIAAEDEKQLEKMKKIAKMRPTPGSAGASSKTKKKAQANKHNVFKKL